MRAHYQKTPITIEEVQGKYSERLSPSHPTHCHIARYKGEPFGMLQCYSLRNYPDFASEIGEQDGVAVDLFIGEELSWHARSGRADTAPVRASGCH
nr:acetyltransferase [Sinorhizobium meliloti]